MEKCKMLVGVFCALFVLGFAGASAALDLGGLDMGSTVKAACTQCHSADKICSSLESKDEDGWKATVTRMVQKGAPLPSAQVDAAVDYLVKLTPGASDLCP